MTQCDCYSKQGRNSKLVKEFTFNFHGEPRLNDIITVSDDPENCITWKIVERRWKTNGTLILIVAPPSGLVPA